MLYHSLTSPLSGLTLRQALLSAGTADGHVLMPDSIPVLPRAFFNNCPEMRLNEIAYVVNNMLFGSDLPSAAIKEVVDRALTFPVDLRKIEDNVYVLELFHGPTMTIKDIAARYMARLIKRMGVENLNIVMASTGNKGAALANSFQNMESAHVFVLFPRSTRRTMVARFTGVAPNVHAIEVDGTIDDCRKISHALTQEPGLNDKYVVSTASSCNLGLMLPLSFVFVYAYARAMAMTGKPPRIRFSIPTANGTTLAAALVAGKMGLPMLPPVAACAASHPGLASALDVEIPSNTPRIEALGGNVVREPASDSEIAVTINDVHSRTGYTFDPHGAAAYLALKRNLAPGETGVVLATAHPALSIDTMTEITGRAIELPLPLTRFMGIQPKTVKIQPTYPAFRRYLSSFK